MIIKSKLLHAIYLQVLLLVFCFIVPGAANAQTGLYPQLECVDFNKESNKLTIHYSYYNLNAFAVTVPIGARNHFSPSPASRGQITKFNPGDYRFAFSVEHDLNSSPTLTWNFAGATVTASNDPARYCSNISVFTYQGKLAQSGVAANGSYDLKFDLYQSETEGTSLGTVELEDVQVTGGIFTVKLKFPPTEMIKANGHYLEIRVRPGAETGAFTIVTPRQQITFVPYAMHSQEAYNTKLLDGFPRSAFVRSDGGSISGVLSVDGNLYVTENLNVTGTITGNLPANSPNYIQNTTTQQAASNFNISGDGSVGGTLSTSRILVSGTNNSVISAQSSSTTGSWLNLQNTSTGGHSWNIISTGSGNGEGAGKLLFNNQTSGGTALQLDSSGATVNGNLNVSGTLANGCRSGFTPIVNGRLCVSAMQAAASFYGTSGAIETCKNMQARVGNSADVMLTLSQSGFNYFGGHSSGWLADHIGDNVWGTWLTGFAGNDFDGPPLNVYNGGTNGTAPVLPYRCVY